MVAAGSARADKFADLLRSIPSTVNAVVLCDVGEIHGSPLGVKSKWAAASPIGFPAGVQLVVIGTQLEPGTLRPTDFQFGIARVPVRITMDELAVRERGARDSLPFAEAVLSPRNAYFMELRPWTIGMVAPANRQEAVQWVRFTRESARTAFSPFLTAAVGNTDRDTQYVLAWDLADALSPRQVRSTLATSPAVANQHVNLDAMATVISGLQGLRLEVRIGDDIKAEIRAEFDRDVGPIAGVALPLLQDALAQQGAAIDELADWTAEAAGKTAIFRGTLSETSFRLVTHILHLPAPNVGSDPESAKLAADLKLLASRQYLTTVTNYLRDLQRPSRRARRSIENYAYWHETFAQRIGQMPTYHVDEELLKFGYGVAERLHAIADSLRGIVVDVNALEKKIAHGVSIGAAPTWGWRSAPFVFIDTNQAQIQAQQREAMIRSQQARDQIWTSIEADTAAVRSRMVQRFGSGF
jgi:hypothetical protein